ncbi:MAG TPA: hypothetical protein VFH29_04030 [Anaerolineales bacterium]|nr:hypothetical protein [Anaerolineales bacterium]
MLLAITREVSRSIAACELTYLSREPIDIGRARQQHAAYELALRALGIAVLSLPEATEMPDAVFIEDTALVLDECAIRLRPGAASRRAEVAEIGRLLSHFCPLHSVEAPGLVDGGDVLRFGRRVYVGVGQRTNQEAVAQIEAFLGPLGYAVEAVAFAGCLHLKSAATEVGPGLVLVNPEWVDPGLFGDVKCIEVEPSEAYAANALLVGHRVLFPEAFTRTRERLQRAHIEVVTVQADELAKAEGALTCCSLILET